MINYPLLEVFLSVTKEPHPIDLRHLKSFTSAAEEVQTIIEIKMPNSLFIAPTVRFEV